jgi:hypothetical protein
MAIIERVKSKLIGSTEKFFLNKETGERYRRVAGGIAWPGINPGYGIVLAETKDKDETLNKRTYKILAEYENENPTDLIRRCAEFSKTLCAYPFYGDTDHRPMLEILQKSNIRLYVTEAPFVDEPSAFKTYVLMIRELTKVGRKALHFGKESKLPALISGLNPQDIPNTSQVAYEQYPPIAALGFAVSALESLVYDDPNEEDLLPDYVGDF